MSQGHVIEYDSPENDQYVSPIFTRPKENGSLRIILNLKKLYESVEYYHFKMETFHSVLPSITENPLI